MSLLKQANLMQNSEFQTKVRIQAIKIASYNLGLETLTREQAEQLSFYKRIVTNPDDFGWVKPLIAVVANNPTILDNTDDSGVNASTDTEIEYVVQVEGLPKLQL